MARLGNSIEADYDPLTITGTWLDVLVERLLPLLRSGFGGRVCSFNLGSHLGCQLPVNCDLLFHPVQDFVLEPASGVSDLDGIRKRTGLNEPVHVRPRESDQRQDLTKTQKAMMTLLQEKWPPTNVMKMRMKVC